MSNKYDFTSGFNKNIKDDAPEWMNDLFENKIEKREIVKINDLFSNDNKPKSKVETCKICGKILATNEISTCKQCQMLLKK